MIEPADPDLMPPAKQPRPAGDGAEPLGELDFTVHLERVFHGPLDLLLQLVREKELEIHVVSLAEVCDAYCRYVRSLEQIEVDEAADYLVVAATLLAIKSRSLLPQEEIEADEDLFDPGEELVQQLLAYKALRQAAEELGDGYRRRARLLPAGGRWLGKVKRAEDEEEEEWDLGEVSIWDLLKVFQRLEEETGFLRPHRLRKTGKPLSAYVEEVWGRLQSEEEVSLRELLSRDDAVREDAAYYLVALLELAKQQAIDVEQSEPFDDVVVRRSAHHVDVQLDLLDEEFDHHGPEPEQEIEELFEGPEPAS